MGGAERVLEAIYDIYPGPIHTLVLEKQVLEGSRLRHATIHTSFVQKLPFSARKYRSYLPFFPLAIEQFDLSEYDIVISSSYAVAKGVLTHANQLHICYCHSPIRYAWDLYHQYLRESGLKKGIIGFVAKFIIHYIRMWDISSTNRVDFFIANSNYIAKRIAKIYNRKATVIYPPVDVDNFTLHTAKEDFYLTASRLVPYKKVDLVVEAFSQMPDKKLIVIGEGPDWEKIVKKAGPNVLMMGYQPFEVLRDHMQRAKAFVFAAEEDFGITPVEAQACGTPVLAYGKGGALETVIDGQTGLFFEKQTSQSLIACVNRFEAQQESFEPCLIRRHAEQFGRAVFASKFKQYVQDRYEQTR